MDGLMILVRSGPGETGRVEEALRLAAAMLGFDELPAIVFIDDGVRCLRPQAFSDPTIQDYLQAAADLAEVQEEGVRCRVRLRVRRDSECGRYGRYQATHPRY